MTYDDSTGVHVQTWADYVREVAATDRQIDMADRTGIDQTTISRWLNGERVAVTPRSVTRFARGYDRPVLEAFVIAGLLDADDASVQIVIRSAPELDELDDAALIAELARRHQAQQEVAS